MICYHKFIGGNNGNIAVAIFISTITLSVLILIQSTILPSVSALRAMVIGSNEFKFSMLFVSFCYFLLFYAIATIISVVTTLLSMGIYMKATRKIDEAQEIRRGNIAVSIVVLGMMLFIRPSVERLIGSFVNYEMVTKM